jgi:hypothetical protein
MATTSLLQVSSSKNQKNASHFKSHVTGGKNVQNPPGIIKTGCSKPMRGRCGNSAGELNRFGFLSSGSLSSSEVSPIPVAGRHRRSSAWSMFRDFRSRCEFNASRLDSVRLVGDIEEEQGTTVVVICSLDAKGGRDGGSGKGIAAGPFGSTAMDTAGFGIGGMAVSVASW